MPQLLAVDLRSDGSSLFLLPICMQIMVIAKTCAVLESILVIAWYRIPIYNRLCGTCLQRSVCS